MWYSGLIHRAQWLSADASPPRRHAGASSTQEKESRDARRSDNHADLGAEQRPDDSPSRDLWAAGAPSRIIALVNPLVMAERAKRIDARMQDTTAATVLQRRCAEVVAAYLLDTHGSN